MPWNETAYLRRGKVNNTGALMGATSSLTYNGFNPRSNTCWYELSQDVVDISYRQFCTAHYVFSPGPPQPGWPIGATGEYRVNLPIPLGAVYQTGAQIIGTWYCSTWWNWGADGYVRARYADDQVALSIRQSGGWATSYVNESTVSAFANQTDTWWHLNIQYWTGT